MSQVHFLNWSLLYFLYVIQANGSKIPKYLGHYIFIIFGYYMQCSFLKQ